jgi:hypothetical protein
MRRKEDREDQAVIPVQDKKLEVGVNINTVLTGLLLAGIVGIWTTLGDIKTSLSELNATMAVVRTEYTGLRRDFDEHRHDPMAHTRLRK